MIQWLLALSLVSWLVHFDFTSLMGLLLYWVPLFINAVCYMTRTVHNYKECCWLRDEGKRFQSDTIGTLIGRLLMTVIPVFNLITFVFTWFPKLFSGFFTWLGAVFDFELVRPLPKKPGKEYLKAMNG